jgi:protoheme IX farnesyltransferase
MPVVAGRHSTRRQILIYAVLLLPLAMLPFWIAGAGLVYGIAALVLSGLFLVLSLRVAVFRNGVGESDMKPEKRLFAFSVFYLFALFAALVADRWTMGLQA